MVNVQWRRDKNQYQFPILLNQGNWAMDVPAEVKKAVAGEYFGIYNHFLHNAPSESPEPRADSEVFEAVHKQRVRG